MTELKKVFVALDFRSQAEAQALLDQLDPTLCGVKIGKGMFTRLGPAWVRQVASQGYQVFLDLKFHDIPNTVHEACLSALDLGVAMMNVHASGGLAMMEAANRAIESSDCILLAVTVLTSLDIHALHSIGIDVDDELTQVLRLTKLAYQANLHGVVASAHEASTIKQIYGDKFKVVTPGIRLEGDSHQDQVRVLTPQKAINMGADHLVIGRSITQSTSPLSVLQSIF